MIHTEGKGQKGITELQKIDKTHPDFVLLRAHNSRERENPSAYFLLSPRGWI